MGCSDVIDYYAKIQEPCHYYDTQPITEHPDCLSAMRANLPVREETFSDPNHSVIDLYEAFQILIAYPLAFSAQNKVLGVAPWSIPYAAFCFFVGPNGYDHCFPDNFGSVPNQRILNMMLHLSGEILYDSSIPEFTVASYNVDRNLRIYPEFYNQSRFLKNAALVHEVRHMVTLFHDRCADSSLGRECDTETSGPNGVEAFYQEALIQGSFWVMYENSKTYALSDANVSELVVATAQRLDNYVTSLPPEVKTRVNFILSDAAGPIQRNEYLQWYPELLNSKPAGAP